MLSNREGIVGTSYDNPTGQRTPGFKNAKSLLDEARERFEIFDAADDVPQEVRDQAVRENWDLEKFNRVALAHVRNSRPPAIGTLHNNGEDLERDLVTAICSRGDIQPKDSRGKAAVRQFGGIGLRELARVCATQEGKHVSQNPHEQFRSAISTASFTNVLQESFNKTFQNAVDTFPMTSPQWTASREVRDFRVGYEVKLSDDNGVLPQLPTSGEFKHTIFTDSKESFYVTTYGEKFVLDRVRFINDDVGFVTRIPQSMARKAMRLQDDLVYALLISNSGVGPTMAEDSTAMFSAGRTFANYSTSSSDVLGDVGLTSGLSLLRSIRGLGGGGTDPALNLPPKTLLVPVALEATARRWMNSAATFQASTTTSVPSGNIWQGVFDIVVEPRLDSATNGTTAWYLVTDPNVMPSIVRVFLSGQTTPTLERSDPADVLGIGWRVYFDCGAGAPDWRGIVRCKGA